MKQSLAIIAAVFILAGCVSTGKDFNSLQVSNIEKGKTKRAQIQAWFGYPYMTGLDNGDEVWIYNFTKSSSRGQANTKNLYIVFEESAKVKSFTYSTSFPEEMSVK